MAAIASQEIVNYGTQVGFGIVGFSDSARERKAGLEERLLRLLCGLGKDGPGLQIEVEIIGHGDAITSLVRGRIDLVHLLFLTENASGCVFAVEVNDDELAVCALQGASLPHGIKTVGVKLTEGVRLARAGIAEYADVAREQCARWGQHRHVALAGQRA